MKKRVVISIMALALLVPNAWAVRTPVHDAAESSHYGRKFGGMIGRGLINVSTSFVDLLVNVVNETRTGTPFVGTLVGLGKGIGCTTLRLGSGAVDLITFWVPGFNGFPVSDSYDNCLAVTSMSPAAAPLSTSPTMEPEWEVSTPQPTAVTPPKSEDKPRYTK